MASIFALGWFWVSAILVLKSHYYRQQQQQQHHQPHQTNLATPEEPLTTTPAELSGDEMRRYVQQTVSELLVTKHINPPRPRTWPTPLNLTLPPLCRNNGWDPQACRLWKPALVNLERRRRKAAMDVAFYLHQAPPAVCGDTRNPVRIELRGSHFRSWWGHVMPKIMQSATQNCSVACDVRWSRALHRHGDAAAFDPPADLIVDTLRPGKPVEHPTKLAVVALESPGGGLVPHDWNSLQGTDMLISWSRQGEVPINYMYAWEALCGTGSALSGGLGRCMQDVPTVADLSQKKFAAAFVSNCGGASHRLKFLKSVIRSLPTGSVDNWGKCLHTAGLPSEASVLRKHRRKIRARAQHVGDKFRGLRKLAVLLDYKFTFAFENAIQHDYVTEKTYHGILASSLPVVWGAPEVAIFMPGGPGSFINALDFDSPQALADYLVMLDSHDEAYLEYFEWRQLMPTLDFLYLQNQNFVNLGEQSWPCRACVQFLEQFCT